MAGLSPASMGHLRAGCCNNCKAELYVREAWPWHPRAPSLDAMDRDRLTEQVDGQAWTTIAWQARARSDARKFDSHKQEASRAPQWRGPSMCCSGGRSFIASARKMQRLPRWRPSWDRPTTVPAKCRRPMRASVSTSGDRRTTSGRGIPSAISPWRLEPGRQAGRISGRVFSLS
jgi:hypothetical protein